ncbi:MAG TPA: GNAT family N-acetyltransferase [Alphaproteobacteria bacterium]|nr:GNAT family N-acetyltransferase [Alphaproteobacteria bacterium]
MNRILIDLPERIETTRLILHMPQAGLGERLHQAMMDGYEDYVKWLNWTPLIPTIQSVEEECRKHHAEFILRDFIRYIIMEKSSHHIIGRCAFPAFQANWFIPQFGISYFIRRSKRKKGYATEAAHAMTLLAFQVLGAKKVEIYCDAENLGSNKIPQKLNFELEYTQRGGWPRQDGKLAELKTYSLFTEEKLPGLKNSMMEMIGYHNELPD